MTSKGQQKETWAVLIEDALQSLVSEYGEEFVAEIRAITAKRDKTAKFKELIDSGKPGAVEGCALLNIE